MSNPDYLDDDDGPGNLTDTEEIMREALYEARCTKFNQIKKLIAEQLGYNPAAMWASQEKEVEDEAVDACESWEEEAEMQTPPSEPITPLQVLLREYWDLGERILDIQDTAIERDLGHSEIDEE